MVREWNQTLIPMPNIIVEKHKNEARSFHLMLPYVPFGQTAYDRLTNAFQGYQNGVYLVSNVNVPWTRLW